MPDWSFGGSGGSGSRGTPRQASGRPAPAAAPSPEPALFHIATRLLNPNKAPSRKYVKQVQQALKGYTAQQIGDAARAAKLNESQISTLQSLSGQGGDVSLGGTAAEAATAGPKLAGGALWALQRPSQATKGLIAQGPEGALRGFFGDENYTGISTVLRGIGQSREQAARAEAGLPGPVRFVGNTAIDIATDPTSYLSFGLSNAGRSAGRSIAMRLAGQAEGEAVLNPEARSIYETLLAGGKKALSAEQQRGLKELSGHLQRKASGLQGGVKVLGKSTVLKGRGATLGSKGGTGFLASAERVMTPRAGLQQAVRAGEAAPGLPEEVGNVLARLRGATHLGELGQRQVQLLGRDEKTFGRIVAKFTPAEQAQVQAAMDIGNKGIATLPAHLRGPLSQLDAVRRADDAALREIGRIPAEGIPTGEYITHVLSPEARAAREAGTLPSVPQSAQMGGPTPGFLGPRTFREAAAAAPPLPGGTPKFSLDPFEAVGLHHKGTIQEVARVQAGRELGNIQVAGKPLVLLDDAAIQANRDATGVWKEIKWPRLSTDEHGAQVTKDVPVLVQKQFAPDIEATLKFMKGGSDTNVVLNGASRLNSLWAKMATANPGFIARNVLQGNVFQGMVLGEARDVRDWSRTFYLMNRMLAGVKRSGDPLSLIKSAADRALVQDAMKDNAVGSGFISSIQEMAHAGIQDVSQSKAAIAGRALLTPANVFQHANRFAEEWGHLAVYAAKRRQGYTSAEAAQTVRHFLFDYQDLSQGDRVARMFNPFWTWTRKNVPLILATAIKDPRKLTVLNHIVENVQAAGEPIQGPVPQWIEQGGGITLPKAVRQKLPLGLGNQGPVAFLPDLPQYQANSVLQPLMDLVKVAKGEPGAESEAARGALNSLGLGGVIGGTLRSGIELGTGKDLFTGRTLQPGARVQTAVGSVPEWQQRVAENVLPILSRLRTISPSANWDKTAQGRRILSALFGTSLYPVSKGAQATEIKRRTAFLQALMKSQSDQGVEFPTDYRKAGGRGSSGSRSSKGGGGWGF